MYRGGIPLTVPRYETGSYGAGFRGHGSLFRICFRPVFFRLPQWFVLRAWQPVGEGLERGLPFMPRR